MELIYITLAVYGMGAATALFPKKMEMAAHYCAVLAAVFGSGMEMGLQSMELYFKSVWSRERWMRIRREQLKKLQQKWI